MQVGKQLWIDSEHLYHESRSWIEGKVFVHLVLLDLCKRGCECIAFDLIKHNVIVCLTCPPAECYCFREPLHYRLRVSLGCFFKPKKFMGWVSYLSEKKDIFVKIKLPYDVMTQSFDLQYCGKYVKNSICS